MSHTNNPSVTQPPPISITCSKALPPPIHCSANLAAVTLPADSMVAHVDMHTGLAYKEGTHPAPLPADANQSYDRKPGGAAGSTQDTGDNSNAFALIPPSDPHSLSSSPTPGPSPSP